MSSYPSVPTDCFPNPEQNTKIHCIWSDRTPQCNPKTGEKTSSDVRSINVNSKRGKDKRIEKKHTLHIWNGEEFFLLKGELEHNSFQGAFHNQE